LPTDDIQGWQDAVLKSLEKKHRAEQEFLMALLQDESSQGMREEARAISEDDRLKRLSELKGKREELDLGVKGKFQLEFQIFKFSNFRTQCLHDLAVLRFAYNCDWFITCAPKFKTEQQPSEIFSVLRHLCGFFTS